MKSTMRRTSQMVLAATIFVAGIAVGTLPARSAAVQNRFGQPKTVLHVVVYKFRDNVSNYDREKAINGIRDMAGGEHRHHKTRRERGRHTIKEFCGAQCTALTNRAYATP